MRRKKVTRRQTNIPLVDSALRDVYDKLNRFYYYDAKEAKMPIFDYMKHKLKVV